MVEKCNGDWPFAELTVFRKLAKANRIFLIFLVNHRVVTFYFKSGALQLMAAEIVEYKH